MRSILKKMTKTTKLIVLVVVIIVVVALIAVLPGLFSIGKTGVTISEASLKEAVSISKLSTAEFTYNGIAEKTNDRGDTEYHIYYEATANAGIDMESIGFFVDEGQKTIAVSLPDVVVGNPVIDESSVEYLPKNANVDLKEVIELCKQDVQSELESAPRIREVAEGNLKTTLEALLMPIIGSEGYTLTWDGDNSDMGGDEHEAA